MYDPSGQTGEPVWLSIRRIRDEYSAYISHDGHNWQKFGNTLVMPDAMPSARVGIFARNGKSDAPPAEARSTGYRWALNSTIGRHRSIRRNCPLGDLLRHSVRQ